MTKKVGTINYKTLFQCGFLLFVCLIGWVVVYVSGQVGLELIEILLPLPSHPQLFQLNT